VDALQLVVALDKNYGLKIPDPEVARKPCRASTPRAAVEAHLQSSSSLNCIHQTEEAGGDHV